MSPAQPSSTWNTGYVLLLLAPFIGFTVTLGDLPWWVQALGVLAVVALVGVGATLLRRPDGGWRPSQTLPRVDDDQG